MNFGFVAMCSDALRFVVMRSYHGFWGIFHGDNTGSNPVGDANKTKDLEKIEPKPEGLKGFDKKRPLSGLIFVLLPFPHDLPCHAAVRRAFHIRDGLRVHIHRHLEVGMAEKFLDRLDVLSVGLHQCSEAMPEGVPAHGRRDAGGL